MASDLMMFPTDGRLSWQHALEGAERTVGQMRKTNYVPKTIVGVARGGMIPAVLIAQLLEVHDVRSVRCQRYDVNHQDNYVSGLNDMLVLIVDDICDKGETHADLYEKYPRARYATLWYKRCPSTLDFPGIKVPEGWLTFPWEIAPEKPLPF